MTAHPLGPRAGAHQQAQDLLHSDSPALALQKWLEDTEGVVPVAVPRASAQDGDG